MPHCNEHDEILMQQVKNTEGIRENSIKLEKNEKRIGDIELAHQATKDTVNKWKWMTAGFGIAYGSITAAMGIILFLHRIGLLGAK